MTKAAQPKRQLFILAILFTATSIGCSDRDAPAAGGKQAQPDSSSRTLSPTEPVSTPSTSVMDAAVRGNADVVRQHIAAGTDLNQRDRESGSTALIAATSLGQNETAILLIEGGADLDVKNNEGSTALHTAAFLCREEIIKALLANGADKKARNKAGLTAFDSVVGPFDEVKPIYDLLQKALGPLGLTLNYERIKATRPRIANVLRGE